MNLKVKAASARPPLCELPVGVAELRSQNLDHGSCFCVCVYEHLLWCYLTLLSGGEEDGAVTGEKAAEPA